MENRQLKTWLSVDEYAQIEVEWQEQLELREKLKDKPSELKRYEEKLRENLHYDSSLRVWFDRDINFEVGGDLSADIVSLPRLVTSRSNEKLSGDSRLTSKQNVKLTVVERAMHNIGRDAAPASKSTVSKLDKFLNADD